MKKIVVLLFIIAVITTTVFADEVPQSIMMDKSQGVFTSTLDMASKVQYGFGELEGNYLFGGLGNVNKADNDSVVSPSPLWIGYYNGGSKPWSIFLGFDHDDITGVPGDSLTVDGTDSSITTGTAPNFVTHTYVTQDTSREQTYKPLAENINDNVSFVKSFGNLNVGVILSYKVNENLVEDGDDDVVAILGDNETDGLPDGIDDWKQYNYTMTRKHYYNSNYADLTLAPIQKLDYTENEEQVDTNVRNTIGVKVPVFIPNGNMTHYIAAGMDIGMQHDLRTFKYDRTVHTNPAVLGGGAFTTYDDVIKDFNGVATDLMLDYRLGMPGLLMYGDDNEFFVEAGLDVTLHSGSYTSSSMNQDYTYSAPGAATVKSTRSEDSTDVSLKGGTDFSIDIAAGQSFYFNYGIADFGFIPKAAFGFSMDSEDLQQDTQKSVTKSDGDDDGAFTTAFDTISTSETTYKNDLDVDTTIGMSLEMPSSVKVQPEGWFAGFVMGSTPRFELASTTYTSYTSETETVSSGVDGTGTDLGSFTSNSAPSVSSSSSDMIYTIDATHRFGLFFDITPDIRLDMDLETNTVLDWEDFRIQASIKLP